MDERVRSEEELLRLGSVRSAVAAVREVFERDLRPGSVSGRLASLAKTALEEAEMWAERSLDREWLNDPDPP